MSTEALIMFLVGATGLWGGLLLAVLNYVRHARRDKALPTT